MKRLLQISVLFLTFVSILVTILPLLNGSYFSMHDRQHIVRLYLLDTAVQQGYWYPRWVDGLGFGFGYALFNFYPPLIYYVALIFKLLGFSYIASIKLALFSGFALSFLGMFLFVRRITKSRLLGVLSAQLYLLAQYHSALVYVRGAFAEFYGYNLLPWVFYAFCLMVEKKQTVWFAIAFALLMLAHPFVAFPFVLMFLVFFATYLIFRKDRFAIFFRTAVGSLWGLGLSAFFWLPSMLERSYTLVDRILTKQMADYKQHFVYIRQLFDSAWRYGGSIPGPEDGLSFELGKIHILLVGVTLAVITYLLVIKKGKAVNKINISVPLMVAGVVSVFMMLFKSQVIWENVSLLWYLQFPWRFLVFVSFFFSAAGIVWLTFVPKKIQSPVVVALMVVILLLYGPLFKPEKLISGSDAEYITKKQVSWEQSKTSFEFMSKDISTYVKNDAVYFPLGRTDLPGSLFSFSATGARGSIVDDLFRLKSISVTAHSETELTLNRSYFPGWSAYLDGNRLSITTHKPVQTMSVRVPKGNHLVQFKFEDTPVRIAGWIISLVAFLLLFQPKKVYDALVSRSRKTPNKL